MTKKQDIPIPMLPFILGTLGLIPFVVCPIGSILMPQTLRWMLILKIFGIVTLSFTSGVQWGISMMHKPSLMANRLSANLFIFGNIIALTCWGLFFIYTPTYWVALMAMAFFLQWVIDMYITQNLGTPDWFTTLRSYLTFVVVFSLIITLILLFLDKIPLRELTIID